jgi:hypothetical protein
MYGAVALATAVTYWRLPPGGTYHFAGTGPEGAASRLVAFSNFPVALAAIAILAAARRDLWAWPAIALCAVAALPGVVSQSDLTARWVNAPALIGVALAVPLSLAAPPGRPAPVGWPRLLLIGLIALWTVPWLIAACGLYAQDLPLLGHVIRSAQPTPGDPSLPSVHRGLHEGLFGGLLAITALLLSVRRAPPVLSLYLALMLVYGLMVTAQDGWHEQVVKRGWTDAQVPSVLTPSLSLAWLGVLLGAVAVHLVWSGRARAA